MSTARRLTAALLAGLLALPVSAAAAQSDALQVQQPTTDDRGGGKGGDSGPRSGTSTTAPKAGEDGLDEDINEDINDDIADTASDDDTSDDDTSDDGTADAGETRGRTSSPSRTGSRPSDDNSSDDTRVGGTGKGRTERDLRRLTEALTQFERRLTRLDPSPDRDALSVDVAALRVALLQQTLTPESARARVQQLIHRLEDLRDDSADDADIDESNEDDGTTTTGAPSRRTSMDRDVVAHAQETIAEMASKVARYTTAGSTQRTELDQLLAAAAAVAIAEPLDRATLRTAIRAVHDALDAVRTARRSEAQRRAADHVVAAITRVSLEDLTDTARTEVLDRLESVLDTIDTLDPNAATATALRSALLEARTATLDAAKAAVTQRLGEKVATTPTLQSALEAFRAALPGISTVADLRTAVAAFRAAS